MLPAAHLDRLRLWLRAKARSRLRRQGARARRLVGSLLGTPVDHMDEVELCHELLGHPGGAPLLIDVGAHHGSSLLPFAVDGWRVEAFEPDRHNRSRLERLASRLPRVRVDPRALGARAQQNAAFFDSGVSSGISALSRFHESHRAVSYAVEVTTLDEVCAERGIDRIDFLKIDTEGHDLFVLRGLRWEKVRPRLVLCEFEDRKTEPLGYRFDDLCRFLQERAYTLLVSEWFPIVEYGRRHRWRRFATYPCRLLDPAGWGNVIACREPEDALALRALARRYGRLDTLTP